MDVKKYIDRVETIRKNELLSVMDLVKELNIAFDTLRRIKEKPETCSLKTMRKLRDFVDGREQIGTSNSYE